MIHDSQMKVAKRINSFLPVRCRVDNLKLRFQFPTRRSEDVLVIISKQDSNPSHENPR